MLHLAGVGAPHPPDTPGAETWASRSLLCPSPAHPWGGPVAWVTRGFACREERRPRSTRTHSKDIPAHRLRLMSRSPQATASPAQDRQATDPTRETEPSGAGGSPSRSRLVSGWSTRLPRLRRHTTEQHWPERSTFIREQQRLPGARW